MATVLSFKEKSYLKIAENQTQCLNHLKKRYEWLKAGMIAMFLFMLAAGVAIIWEIHDFKTKPVTVLIDNQLQELDKLPLPPLEEIKE